MHNFLISIKKRIVLIVSILLLVLSLFFSYTILKSMDYFNLNKQTIVGTIYLDNIEEFQYKSYISSKVNEWENKSTYKVIYQEYILDIDLSYFNLDIDNTIDSIQEGKNNKVKFNITNESKEILLNEFIDTFSIDIINSFDFDLFLENLISHLEDMNIFKTYNLEDFLNPSISETIIDSVTISNLAIDDVDNITDSLNHLIITKYSRFYLLEECDDLTLTNNQLSILASSIQKITKATPFSGYIFNQNTESTGWNDIGMNVRILKTNNYDFSFYNPLSFDYTINIRRLSLTSITVELVGYPFSTKYSVSQVVEEVLPYPTIYYNNDLLDALTDNIIIIDTDSDTIYHLLIQAGIDGEIIVFTRTSTKPDLTVTTEIIYREIYFSTPEIMQENIVPKAGG